FLLILIFFFQAEDGIRDSSVTGVQTCALPICSRRNASLRKLLRRSFRHLSRDSFLNDAFLRELARLTWRQRNGRDQIAGLVRPQIGRASCRERVEQRGREVEVKRDSETMYDYG